MKVSRSLTLVLLMFAPASVAGAQLTNNGATIVIEQGATLVVEGNIDNVSGGITNAGEVFIQGPGVPSEVLDFGIGITTATGTITNSGTIEVQGNFTNNAGFVPSDDFLYLKFDAAPTLNLYLGDIFPANLSQSQIDASYVAQISEFGSASPTPLTIPIVVVPEPTSLALLSLGGLLLTRRRRA